MGAIIDTCRRAEFALSSVLITTLQRIVIWWAAPTNVYFTAGWELRIRRVIAAVIYALFGLSQLWIRARHAKSISAAFFGVPDCPSSRADAIISATWWFFLQFCSCLLWSPLSWCCRRLSTPSASLIVKCVKMAFLGPVQLLRGLFWMLAAFFVGILWVGSSFAAPLYNVFVVPFGVIVFIICMWLFLLYVMLDESCYTSAFLLAIAETKSLARGSLSKRHALQVVGNIASYFGYFGCRDRWFRRDALNAGIGDAVRATLPGLIGPICCNQRDVRDAVAAIRGLRNIWRDLDEKEKFVDDPETLVYTLSYRHMPVHKDGRTIRLSEERATNILQNVMAAAKRHGYRRFMLWCDGASAAGVRTDRAWVDIGLLPYAVYRTVRVETRIDGESVMSGRLWLELEKALSGMTCGMDVVNEYIHGRKVMYEVDEAVDGQGHRAMAGVLRVSSRIAQGDYAACAVSREADKTDTAAWARRLLMRSGLKEMNESLGWRGEPAGDRRAKSVLMRVATLSLRTNDEGVVGEVADVGARNKVAAGHAEGEGNGIGLGCAEEQANEFGPGHTEFWLRLMQFTEEEIGRLENEELGSTSVRFEEKNTGRWDLHVVNLQGDYYSSMAMFEHIGSSVLPDIEEAAPWALGVGYKKRRKGVRWLLTNSQVKKSGQVKEWAKEIIEETFKARRLECDVVFVEHDNEETETEDTPVAWFSNIIGEVADWQKQIAVRLKEKKLEAGNRRSDDEEYGAPEERVRDLHLL